MKANCKTCKKVLHYDAKSCNKCGDIDPFYIKAYKSKKPKWQILNLLLIVTGILGLAYFVGGGASNYLLGLGWLGVCLLLTYLVVFKFQKSNHSIYSKAKELCIDSEALDSCEKTFGYK